MKRYICAAKSYEYRGFRIYDTGYGYIAYAGYRQVSPELLTTQETEEFIDNMLGAAYKNEESKTYTVRYVDAYTDRTSTIEVTADGEIAAKQSAQNELGKRCYRIVDVVEG